ncbi:hypothetical protein ABIA39_004789 [Nocardia sp. GAS34]
MTARISPAATTSVNTAQQDAAGVILRLATAAPDGHTGELYPGPVRPMPW